MLGLVTGAAPGSGARIDQKIVSVTLEMRQE